MSVLRIFSSLLIFGSVVSARPQVHVDRVQAGPLSGTTCANHEGIRCMSHFALASDGTIKASAAPAATGLTPADLQSAYAIDTANEVVGTIAIIDAFGYANLESDLATSRSQFGLPACTRANGCLTVVDQNGGSSLPDDPPSDDDWTVETALDVDMASAACPKCKLVVVQAAVDNDDGLYIANNTAATLHATVISNSWGSSEYDGVQAGEAYLNHPGIAVFASGGDHGYDNAQGAANYPATSQYVIGVGGTSLVKASNARGWTETVWSMGGNGCSAFVPKPSFQTSSPCNFRASDDLAAVGDLATGVSIYNAGSGGWLLAGGTSAASPLVAAVFAGAGKGNSTPLSVSQQATAFNDVTSGANGSCGSLCTAGVGWDGPSGFGTPNQANLMSGGTTGSGGGGSLTVAITQPVAGQHVSAGFPVVATITGPGVAVGFGLDGTLIDTLSASPYVFHAPAQLAAGAHEVEVAVEDADNNIVVTRVTITVDASYGPPDDTGEEMAGCSVSGGKAGLPVLVALGFVLVRRRKRV